MDGNMQQGQMFSTTNFMRLVIKIFGILGMVFLLIAIFVPWASYTIPGTNWGLNLNGWGISTSIPSGTIPGADDLFSDVFYINTMQTGITTGIVAGICMILVFIFTIITLLIGLMAFRKISKGGINKTYLFAGIFSIITMVLCVIAVTQANSYGTEVNSQMGGAALSGGFGYTWGFILTIIAMIFFFINYGINISIMQQGMGMQQQMQYQQPQMMYTSQYQQPMQQSPMQEPTFQQTQPMQQTQQTPMSGKFCTKCGSQLQAGVKFCSSCGAKI